MRHVFLNYVQVADTVELAMSWCVNFNDQRKIIFNVCLSFLGIGHEHAVETYAL